MGIVSFALRERYFSFCDMIYTTVDLIRSKVFTFLDYAWSYMRPFLWHGTDNWNEAASGGRTRNPLGMVLLVCLNQSNG